MSRADDLADRYATGALTDGDETLKEWAEEYIACLDDELGESPEAWRGAERAFLLYGRVIYAISTQFDSSLDGQALQRVLALLTGAFLNHPCSRAERARRG